VQFDEGELRGPVDRDEEIELALSGSNLGDVDMEIADRVAVDTAAVSSMFIVACSSSAETTRSAARAPRSAPTLDMTKNAAAWAIAPSFFRVAAIDLRFSLDWPFLLPIRVPGNAPILAFKFNACPIAIAGPEA
jgi:hypothetical protein